MATSQLDYSKIENFPEGATIQKNGQHMYVIRRTYTYDSLIKRWRESSHEIMGQVVNNVYYTNSQYRAKFQRGMVERRVPLISEATQVAVPQALAQIPGAILAQLVKSEIHEVGVKNCWYPSKLRQVFSLRETAL